MLCCMTDQMALQDAFNLCAPPDLLPKSQLAALATDAICAAPRAAAAIVVGPDR